MNFWHVLTLILVVLKLTGVIGISWFLVVLPFFIPLLFLLGIAGLALLGIVGTACLDSK